MLSKDTSSSSSFGMRFTSSTSLAHSVAVCHASPFARARTLSLFMLQQREEPVFVRSAGETAHSEHLQLTEARSVERQWGSGVDHPATLCKHVELRELLLVKRVVIRAHFTYHVLRENAVTVRGTSEVLIDGLSPLAAHEPNTAQVAH